MKSLVTLLHRLRRARLAQHAAAALPPSAPHFQVHISPVGRTANQMFQYMFAVALRIRSGRATRITGLEMPEWTLPSEAGESLATVSVDVLAHVVPLDALVQMAQSGVRLNVNLRNLSTRMCYYTPHLDAYRAIFRPVEVRATGYDNRHLLIHVRGTDALAGEHPNYVPAPLSWYAQLIGETGLQPVFIGELGDDLYTEALRARFPHAIFRALDSWQNDFNVLRTSAHIALSVSTFAWLATWLSETAISIHLPVIGLFHPDARPDIDMLPVDDARYAFHLFDILRWGERDSTLSMLMNGHVPSRRISPAAMRKRFAGLIGTDGVAGTR